MKTKEIHLLVAAFMLAAAGWTAWRFTAIDKVVEPSKSASLPGQQTAPPAPKTTPVTVLRTTGKPTVSENREKVEIAKKFIGDEISRAQANLDTMRAGPRAVLRAHRDRTRPEDVAFLKSLGLSDELRDKVYDMLTARADLYWVHEEKIKEAAQKRESYTGYISEMRQKEADIKAAVGTENYAKLKYYESTPVERGETARFKTFLQSRSLPLTEQREAAVVDAMVRSRRVGFSLGSPSISMEDKLAYIATVKQNLGTVLNANDMAFLEQHLKEAAELPQRHQALRESNQKRAEERKMKAANPPAPPR
jgi:hypothetical protein